MPPKRQPPRKPYVLNVSANPPRAPRAPSEREAKRVRPALADILLALQPAPARASVRTVSGEYDLVDDEKKENPQRAVIVRDALPFAPLLRSLFKSDHPYRTKIGYFGSVMTSAAGVVNSSFLNTSISSSSEWASIDALFDEFFLHSAHYTYKPRNVLAAGVGSLATAAYSTYVPAGAGAVVSLMANSGAILVSLFHGASAYTSASAMVVNPTRKVVHTGESWKYAWRNNERFDPRGPGLAGVAASWQGWMAIANVANIGGFVQLRTFSDVALGDTAHALTMGDVMVEFDVSFRARA